MGILARLRNRPRPLQQVGQAGGDVSRAADEWGQVAVIAQEIGMDVAAVVDGWRSDGEIVVNVTIPFVTTPLRLAIPIAPDTE